MTRKYKETVAYLGSVISAMDYSPVIGGTSVQDTLKIAAKAILELDQLIDEMPKVLYNEDHSLSSDDLLVFLEQWHDWQKKVTAARRGKV